jgi:hypothetical protein
MEFLSLDPDAELIELDKECLSSGKILNDLKNVIRFLQSDPRPRRHIRNAIAASIFAMQRINNAAAPGAPVFIVKSSQLAQRMKDAITPTNSYFLEDERRLIIADLCNFYHAIKNVVENQVHNDMTEKLRFLITPQHVVFDSKGSLSPEIVSNLCRAGAKNIAIFPDTAGLITVEVRGSASEDEFLEIFSALNVGPSNPTLNVVYHKVLIEKLNEELDIIQMGDYTGPNFPFSHELRSEEDIAMWGEVAKGTVGALLLLQDPPSTVTSRTVRTMFADEIVDCVTSNISLWGSEEHVNEEVKSESNNSFARSVTVDTAISGLCVLTAAHVGYGKLKYDESLHLRVTTHLENLYGMSTNSTEENLESHREKLVAMISGISKLNADYNRCAIYNHAIDVALLPLPAVRSHSSTKLNVASDNHSNWTSWGPICLLPDTLVVKIGAKTGITVGKYAGITELLTDDDGAAYSNCVSVAHASTSCRFCKPGDSGSIYFALILGDPNDDAKTDSDVLDWLPIAIHRTSNGTHSFGTPLNNALQALMDANKIAKNSQIRMIHQVVRIDEQV